MKLPLILAAVGCILVATACSPSGSGHPARTAPTSPSSSAAAPAASQPPKQYPLPTEKVANVVDKRKAVDVSNCKATPGGWGASGTVRNEDANPETYAITVYFTTTHATYIDYAQTNVIVPAHGSRPWAVAKNFTRSGTLLCVLTGVG